MIELTHGYTASCTHALELLKLFNEHSGSDVFLKTYREELLTDGTPKNSAAAGQSEETNLLMKPRFRQVQRFGRVALTISLVWLAQSCAPQGPNQQVDSYAADQVADQGAFPIHYAMTGTSGNPLVVFIHGTPGSSQAFRHLLTHAKLQACCHLVAVDRLGFGASAASGVQVDFDVQSAAIAEVFRQNQSGLPILLVGHSFGGSIAAQLAITNPEPVGALLIISSALDPTLSGPRWYQRLADLPIIKQILPEKLHRANEEVLSLRRSLDAMAHGWGDLSIPVTIIQGGKDPLVDYKNPAFAEQILPASQLRVQRFPKAGHFILWEQPEVIVDEILSLVPALYLGAQAVDQQTLRFHARTPTQCAGTPLQ